MQLDAFISYAHRDEEFALRLASDLEDRGADVWVDRGNIPGGSRWRASIADGIGQASALVLIVSPHSVRSRHVRDEVETALQIGKPVVPVLYRRARLPADLAPRLERIQQLNFRRGGYGRNLQDLISALRFHGSDVQAAPEDVARRRRERLGAPVRAQWGAVIGRIPGWAAAWALGWVIFWAVLIGVATAVNSESTESLSVVPTIVTGGLASGLAGGLVAGLVTMIALRKNAASIRWRHMSRAIGIWGLVGPLGVFAAGGLAVALFQISSGIAGQSVDCAGLDPGECFGAAVGEAIGRAIASVALLMLMVIGYAFLAILAIGCLAGALAVRHIRRLEPGILGRHGFAVILGWGAGAVVAAVSGVAAVGLLIG